MAERDQSDVFHLRAAEGWLDLGNSTEALAELRHVSPASLARPDALALRWEIAAGVKNWDECLTLGNALISADPDDQRGWIAICQTLYFTKHFVEAYHLGLTKLPQFDTQWQFLYELACYASLVGEFEQSRCLLQRAMAFGDRKKLKQLAQNDPDLQSLFRRRAGGTPARTRTRSRRRCPGLPSCAFRKRGSKQF